MVHRLLASVSAHSALQMHLCTALFISVVVPAMAVTAIGPVVDVRLGSKEAWTRLEAASLLPGAGTLPPSPPGDNYSNKVIC
ncbi:hypothetical protein Pmani_013508 [Petrolisthes manimaculis]|uniref:Uncharacterized protein n=1 Tax=Petrolisthes manimaculis TaxID=1843537 RepID=A0AAE1NKH8_9EUCA|nr:hypothetical protein Pmani_035494 [Petrolisthes manimaculis]KAK4315258.1 hypothetical protein Pmani_013508 [Petrolisthes manimaculis]